VGTRTHVKPVFFTVDIFAVYVSDYGKIKNIDQAVSYQFHQCLKLILNLKKIVLSNSSVQSSSRLDFPATFEAKAPKVA